MKLNAVFEGGGVKAIALVGAVQTFEEHGFRWNMLAGTSAGSLVATLIAAGYNGQELYDILIQNKFADLLQKDRWNRIPLAGNLVALWFRYGIYSGDHLREWVFQLLARKNIYTFGDLPDNRLKIIASDISNGRMLVLPDDISRYGLNPERFLVARAVLMSCCLPYYFRPVVLKGRRKKIFIVDGAILSNYPIWIFDKVEEGVPTIGFRLSSKKKLEDGYQKITSPFGMYRQVLRTMMDAHDRMYIDNEDAKRTVFIPTAPISTTDFNLTSDEKEELYQRGRRAAEKFIAKWKKRPFLMHPALQAYGGKIARIQTHSV
ncbi:MAG: patatin-like phospholipase family protein [Bacillaceae bacterium]|nr:patatin-like phospholipase family protein [Bacillaceae bacterium]